MRGGAALRTFLKGVLFKCKRSQIYIIFAYKLIFGFRVVQRVDFTFAYIIMSWRRVGGVGEKWLRGARVKSSQYIIKMCANEKNSTGFFVRPFDWLENRILFLLW